MNKRIISIDVLRGFALLGILIMNVTLFAMPSQAYFNPFVYALSVWDQVWFAINHVIADQKFMAIFSMLFGASTLLFIQSAEQKGKKAGSLFYRRNFWLLIIGGIHFVFIWHGDILMVYALCSFVLYLFRNLNPRLKFVGGLLIYLIPAFLSISFYGIALDQISPAEQEALINHWHPDESSIQKEMDAFQGTYAQQIGFRLEEDKPVSDSMSERMNGLF
ncbi:MAG: hypothetical protein AAGM67_20955, partial [Bacteroidota bacterium]